MANKKFSEFTDVPAPDGTENIAGYKGANNVKMTLNKLADFAADPGRLTGPANIDGTEDIVVRESNGSLQSTSILKVAEFVDKRTMPVATASLTSEVKLLNGSTAGSQTLAGVKQVINPPTATYPGGAVLSDLIQVQDVFSPYTPKQLMLNDLKALLGITSGVKAYKSYEAVLSASGTDNPTATVLSNDLGFDISWARQSVGDYRGTISSGSLPAENVKLVGLVGAEAGRHYDIYKWNTTTIVIGSYDNSTAPIDGLPGVFVEIRIYP